MAQVNDLSRSLTAFDPISTLVVVVEMSKASWPPAVAPPALTTPSLPPPAVPAPHSSEPKKIHTVIIRSDGSEQTAISAVAAAYSATNTRAPAAKPSTAAAR